MYDIVLRNTNGYLFTICKKCLKILNFYLRFSKLFRFFWNNVFKLYIYISEPRTFRCKICGKISYYQNLI